MALRSFASGWVRRASDCRSATQAMVSRISCTKSMEVARCRKANRPTVRPSHPVGATEAGLAGESGTGERCEEPLVRVDDERVGVLDPPVAVAHARRQQVGAAVGTAGVEPQTEVVGHLSDAIEVVDDAGIGRAGGGDHADDVGGTGICAQCGPEVVPCEAVVFRGYEEGLDADDAQRVAQGGVCPVGQGDPDRCSVAGATGTSPESRAVTRADRFPAEPPEIPLSHAARCPGVGATRPAAGSSAPGRC
jgi:hypothetical protein